MEEEATEVVPERPSLLVRAWRAKNVEPVLFLFFASYHILSTMTPLFQYWARCVEMFEDQYDDVEELCESRHLNVSIQNAVDKDMDMWNVYLLVIGNVPALIVAPLLGAWSDRHIGRKIPLLISLGGGTLFAFCRLMCVLTYKHISVYYGLMFSNLCLGIVGSFAAIYGVCYAMVTDEARSKEESMTFRVGVAAGVSSLGRLTGSLLSFLMRKFITHRSHSYFLGMLLGQIMAIMATFYAAIFVRETYFPVTQSNEEQSEIGWNWKKIPQTIKKVVCDVFEVVSVPRVGWTRLCLNLMFLVVFAELLVLDNNLLLLYVKHDPLNWQDVLWTANEVAKGVLFSIGLVILPYIFSKLDILGRDSMMILVGVLFAAAQNFLIAFSDVNWMIFIATGMVFFVSMLSPGYNSFISKLVKKEETARVYGLFGVIANVVPILSTLLFAKVFNATLSFWPGMSFLICAAIDLLVFAVQLVVHLLMVRTWKQNSEDTEALVENQEQQED